MAEFPALPVFTDAYMRDCWHLSDAEHGRYFLLLMLIWQTPQCRIPNDREWISRKMRRSPEVFDLELKPLIDEFCKTDGNWITQKRLSKEFEYLTARSKKQRASAKARWQKEKTSCQTDASRHASGNAPTPTPTPTPIEEKNNTLVRKRTDEDPEGFTDFWAAYPKRDGSADRKGAVRAFGAAVKRADRSAIMDGLRQFADAMAARGKTGTEFIPQARTWLNGNRWEETYDATPEDPRRAQWLAILEKHRAPPRKLGNG